ncbi:MAG: GGDEF domain-containing protein [Vulcanimicrobiota bacterium]
MPRYPCLQMLDGNQAGQVYQIQQSSLNLGRAPECDWQILDSSVSGLHARLQITAEGAELQDLQSTNGTFLEGESCSQPRLMKPGDIFCLGHAIHFRFSMLTQREIGLAQALYQNATRDGLTGLLNRPSFFAHAEQEMAMFLRSGKSFGFLLMDLDHFKRVNDTFGHPTGDELLRQVAQVLRTDLRLEDVLGRYGGEEFCCLVRAADALTTMEVAERLRRVVGQVGIEVPGKESPYRPTISIGLSCPRSQETLSQLVDRADQALYEAKESGRNRSVLLP